MKMRRRGGKVAEKKEKKEKKKRRREMVKRKEHHLFLFPHQNHHQLMHIILYKTEDILRYDLSSNTTFHPKQAMHSNHFLVV